VPAASPADNEQPVQQLGDAGQLEWSRGCGPHGSCVEIAKLPDGQIAIRDGKAGDGGAVLFFSGDEWSSFVTGVKAGEFD
jgi:Domain of unknown function (DUF397)